MHLEMGSTDGGLLPVAAGKEKTDDSPFWREKIQKITFYLRWRWFG